MAKLIYISGGQRSGKSSYGQRRVEELTDNPTYLATARVWDSDMDRRIEKHRMDRGSHWKTIECPKEISKIAVPDTSVVLLDCVTLWLSNWSYDLDQELGDEKEISDQDYVDMVLEQTKREWDAYMELAIPSFVISNEIGMGLHAETPLGRRFVDIQGFMNQYIANEADETIFMVSGIPHKIKG